MDYWRLCDELTVIQAALLIVGEDPSSTSAYVEGWQAEQRPIGYEAAKSALLSAISSKILPADKRSAWIDCDEHNPLEVLIRVTDLREWLVRRGITTGFFFSKNTKANTKPNYLDEQHSNYSPKLAAAIEAWLALTENPQLIKAKSVKKALTVWLRSNAGRFGLIKDNGSPNENGIEEVSKVANWKTKGGAPKTPDA